MQLKLARCAVRAGKRIRKPRLVNFAQFYLPRLLLLQPKIFQFVMVVSRLQKYLSQATQWEIFQLTLNSKQSTSVFCIHFRKAEMAQQSCCHLKVVAIVHRRLCSTLVPVVYLQIFFLVTVCKLNLRVTINLQKVLWNSSCMRKQCVPGAPFAIFKHLGMRL